MAQPTDTTDDDATAPADGNADDPTTAVDGGQAVSVAGLVVEPYDLLSVYVKGLFMGMADTVPGVSGGTIALVTGIYERLIAAITAADPRDVRHLARVHTAEGRREVLAVLDRVDAPFLGALGLGILSAVVTVAQVIEVVAERYPGVLAAFFFGLIAASAVVLYGEVDLASPGRIAVAVAGVVAAVAVTGATGGGASHALPVVFLSGAIAVCAMVLPGISGAFLLLILGQYEFMLGALNAFTEGLVGLLEDGSVAAVLRPADAVVVFVAGATVGLLTIAHAIRWALEHYRAATLTFLVSLMVGGLKLPAEQALRHVEFTAAGAAPAVLAAVGGAVGVLVFDHFTDDLDYA